MTLIRLSKVSIVPFIMAASLRTEERQRIAEVTWA